MAPMLRAVAGYVLLGASVVSTAIVLYAMKILHNNKNEIYFHKRGISFLWILCFVFGINTLILRPLHIIDNYLIDLNNTVSTVRFLLSYFVFFGQVNVLIARLFYLTVQVKRSTSASVLMPVPSSSSSELTSTSPSPRPQTRVADPGNGQNSKTDYKVKEPNWYSFFGSERKMFTVVAVACFIQSLYVTLLTVDLLSLTEGLKSQLRSLSQALLLLILAILVLVAYKTKILRFNDHWFIRRELSIILRVLILTYIVGILVVSLWANSDPNSLANVTAGIANIVMNLLYSICVVYVSVIWAHKINKRVNENISTSKVATQTQKLKAVELSVMNIASMSTTYSESAKRKSLDMLANHQVSRLHYFWDEAYDKENEYVNVSKEFEAFFQSLCL